MSSRPNKSMKSMAVPKCERNTWGRGLISRSSEESFLSCCTCVIRNLEEIVFHDGDSGSWNSAPLSLENSDRWGYAVVVGVFSSWVTLSE